MGNARAWLIASAFVVGACGYDRPADVAGSTDDAAVIDDAAIDAAIDGPSESALGDPCDPLDQNSCGGTNGRCAWFVDQDNPPLGHSGCAPAGTVAVDDVCTVPTATTGPSTCMDGSECLGGTCKLICKTAGGAPGCDANHSCVQYADIFDVATTGVCEVGCDPLTQDLLLGTTRTACGSPTPTMPSKGCFGFSSFQCAPSSATSWSLTDRQPPRTNAQGNPYLNGCAPGFAAMLLSATGSTSFVCAGYCSALETDNTAAHLNNGIGSPTALAKLPLQAAPAAGNATCAPNKKGSENTSRCRFLWPYLVDGMGQLPPAFQASPLLDTLGICIGITHYQYDSNGDQSPDTNYPECNTLPPRSTATTGDYDDAADFACQRLEHSTIRPGPAIQDLRVASPDRPPILRHDLQ